MREGERGMTEAEDEVLVSASSIVSCAHVPIADSYAGFDTAVMHNLAVNETPPLYSGFLKVCTFTNIANN